MKLILLFAGLALTASAARTPLRFPVKTSALYATLKDMYRKGREEPQIPKHDTGALSIPLGGNSWIVSKNKNEKAEVTNDGWKHWESTATIFSTYVRINKPGALNVSAAIESQGESEIKCTIAGKTQRIKISGSGDYVLGRAEIRKAGYVKIDLQGISKTSDRFGKLGNIKVSGPAVDDGAAYVKDNNDNYFYWGRRGPSVHLNYDTKEAGESIEWFYNEINVPAGFDPVGSYFMADGFAEGYFGMQVNSPEERRILFSVWSPFSTDDPASIPPDKRIKLLSRGEGVHAGEFGNEGSGGQSFLRYNWKAGNTYKFLLHARPDSNNNTVFTAYFCAPGMKEWMMIASFQRPHTSTYLKRLHSFLENFEPATGYIERKAWYQNQWVRTSNGKWIPLTKVIFTGDRTAAKGFRLDYAGGSKGGKFFLRNCGFFNDNVPLKTTFMRSGSPSSPPPMLPEVH